jgi:hypothetical protein
MKPPTAVSCRHLLELGKLNYKLQDVVLNCFIYCRRPMFC